MADPFDAAAYPWGTFRPRGLAALCLWCVRKRVLRLAAAELLCRLGPIYDVEVAGLRHRVRAGEVPQFIERGWPVA